MARQIVIGDVHGHYGALCQLLTLVAPSQTDTVYLLGDLIDRGPCSAQVVTLVQREGYRALLGNHEDQLIRAAAEDLRSPAWDVWLQMGGEATLSSFGALSTLLDYVPWFQQLPTHLDLGDAFLSHAGLNPRRSLAEQRTQDFCWSRLDFLNEPQPYFPHKRIVLGHTPTCKFPQVQAGQILAGPNWLDIDTGVDTPQSGWLAALSLEDDQVFQVNRLTGEQRVLDRYNCQQTYVPLGGESLLRG
jgi:serine/threonine protein phosphatase 1